MIAELRSNLYDLQQQAIVLVLFVCIIFDKQSYYSYLASFGAYLTTMQALIN